MNMCFFLKKIYIVVIDCITLILKSYINVLLSVDCIETLSIININNKFIYIK